MKKHRIFVFCIVFAVIAGILSSTAFAISNPIQRSSPTLMGYGAKLSQGSVPGSGKIIITYDVMANGRAESLGVSSIEIYKSDNSYVTTITGNTMNGLIASRDITHRSSYIYTGVSGTYYYAILTVFATINGVTDSRTITTSTVQAP